MTDPVRIGGFFSLFDTEAVLTQLRRAREVPLHRLEVQKARADARKAAVADLASKFNALRSRTNTLVNSLSVSQKSVDVSGSGVTANATASALTGSFTVDVHQIATATRATGVPLSAGVDDNELLSQNTMAEKVTAGSFTINGVSINVDPNSDSLNDVLDAINSSGAGVVATYSATTDKVVIENDTPGDTSLINLGASGDTSNVLSALNVLNATQITGGSGSTVVESTRNLGAINPGAALNATSFAGGAVTAGSFAINGVSINVDPDNDSLSDVLARINASDAGVTASYDSLTDTVRVVSDRLGSRTVKFTAGSSNFLSVTNLDSAVQDAGQDSQFRINGGAVQTRNTNTIEDAITGVTLELAGPGTSTVTVGVDEETIVEEVRGLLEEFNEVVNRARTLTGQEGGLANDGSIRSLGNTLRQMVFNQVESGPFNSLVAAGISTGGTFSQGQDFTLQLDDATFLEALRNDPDALTGLFTNDDGDGIADRLEEFLDGAAGLNGYLQERTRQGGTIDNRIQGLENQIERQEARLELREARLRQQFAQVEQLASSFQQSGASLASLGSGLGMLQQ